MVSIDNPEPKLLLPPRPKLSKEGENLPSIGLRINHFELATSGSRKNVIFCYSLSIFPEIDPSARKLRYDIVNAVKKQLEQELGKFLISGWMMFSTKKKENPIKTEVKKGSAEQVENDYVLTAKLVEERDIGGISSLKKEPVTQFFNILIKKALRENKFVEIGRNSKFYDVSKKIEIKAHRLSILPGFKTSTDVYKDGLFTLIDFSSRILHSDTVLRFIRDLQREGYKNGEISDELRFSSVVAAYGNYRMWKVDDLIWEKTPLSKFKHSEEEISYVQYYKAKYNIAITEMNQPLILSKDRRSGVEFFLIPELVNLTGLPDEMKKNRRIMKDLAEHTQLNPDTRMNRILQLSDLLNKTLPKLIDDVQLDSKSNSLKGRKLKEPAIILGNGNIIDPAGGSFILREPVIERGNFKNWAIIYDAFDYEHCDKLYKSLKKCSGSFGILVSEPLWIEVDSRMSKNPKEWEKRLRDCLLKSKDLLILVALLPTKFKATHYPIIKRFTCQTSPIPSQVVVTSSLAKNELSVCSKILLQMNAKLGLTLWQTQIPKDLPQHTMIVGVDVFHNVGPKNRKRSVVGFCGSLDPAFTKFHTQVFFQDKIGDEFIATVPSLVKKCVAAYFVANKKTLPDTIIFYRDGVGESQKEIVMSVEVSEILKSLETLYSSNPPKIAYFIVTKKLNDRFFTPQEEFDRAARPHSSRGGYGAPKSGLSNPPSGTIVGEKVVSRNFDFFLIAQNVTIGTCTPTRYEAIFNSTDIPEDVFWRLTYYQCFNYYNWNGAIRIPACTMYASKAGFMVGQNLTENPDESLAKTLYFL